MSGRRILVSVMSWLDVEITITTLSVVCIASSFVVFHRFARVSILVLALWCAVLAQGAEALAVTSFNPIVIGECRIRNTRSYVSAFKPIELTFTNRRATPADEIRFTVEYAGRTEHISDVGTFSQGIWIDHAFNGFYNVRYRGPSPSCSIDYVEFRDGSVWRAEGASSAPKCP
jgi:hypothetical protein